LRATINAATIEEPRHRILILIVARFSPRLSRYKPTKEALRNPRIAENPLVRSARVVLVDHTARFLRVQGVSPRDKTVGHSQLSDLGVQVTDRFFGSLGL
jgi:hypothetical protein